MPIFGKGAKGDGEAPHQEVENYPIHVQPYITAWSILRSGQRMWVWPAYSVPARSQPSFFISAQSQRCRAVRSGGDRSEHWMPCWPSLLVQATRPTISVSPSWPGIRKIIVTEAP